jgi:glutathione S-transferase
LSAIVLHQFQFSHYNEKARWALDYKGVAYEKHSLLPGFHIPAMLWLSGQRQLPVLEANGQVIAGSGAIIAHLEETQPEPPLHPSEPRDRRRALEIARWFDEELGPAIRRAFFFDLLAEDGAARVFTLGRTDATALLFHALFPLTRAIFRQDMEINAEAVVAARRVTEEGFERVVREVGPGGYLVGNRFSVADLTAAALLSPAVMPPEFPITLPEPRPRALVEWNERWAAHPGGQWVLDIYRRHRRAPASTSSAPR